MATVLIVDDDRPLRKLLRAYLEDESIAVVEAGSGEEALATGSGDPGQPSFWSPSPWSPG